jgi:hypothetical protein
MLVLVNGCPTEEINIQRGLKQGDPLAPFLFLLVAEGLGGLMKRAVASNCFNGFRIGNSDMVVSHLQYADDTLFIGEATIDNLWTIKAILRGFEIISGLKVNFWKSNLMRVNVSNEFIRVASGFLNCRVGSIPFKYLGLPVGANPRRASTWEPLLDSLRKRLGAWGNRYVSLGGRVVLLNSVLNAIPIFYLSYMKLPIHVWKKIRRLQREFLWGGRRDKTRIPWIKWDVVCLPKRMGGLGVRDVRVVNISLLAKWRWRLLSNDNAIWKDVIRCKYGEAAIGKVELGDNCKPWFSSLWWKDVCSIGLNLNTNWFAQNVVKDLGNGALTFFWEDSWVGNVPLKLQFPRLFSISSQKEAMVADVYTPGLVPSWGLLWRRRLFVWEEDLLANLLNVLHPVTLSEEDDRWRWRPEEGNDFTVKSTFLLISNLSMPAVLIPTWHAEAFKVIWKCLTPSKVSAFVWQLLHDRIPTRVNLLRRRIIDVNGDFSCPLCHDNSESSLHLFLYCDVALKVWAGVFDWLNLPFSLPHTLFSLLNYFTSSGCKGTRKGLCTVWNATVWALWRHRNSIVFENGIINSAELVLEAIMVSSWKWWMSHSKSHPLLYEWRVNPKLCMLY